MHLLSFCFLALALFVGSAFTADIPPYAVWTSQDGVTTFTLLTINSQFWTRTDSDDLYLLDHLTNNGQTVFLFNVAKEVFVRLDDTSFSSGKSFATITRQKSGMWQNPPTHVDAEWHCTDSSVVFQLPAGSNVFTEFRTGFRTPVRSFATVTLNTVDGSITLADVMTRINLSGGLTKTSDNNGNTFTTLCPGFWALPPPTPSS
jgi:hypothetical protein